MIATITNGEVILTTLVGSLTTGGGFVTLYGLCCPTFLNIVEAVKNFCRRALASPLSNFSGTSRAVSSSPAYSYVGVTLSLHGWIRRQTKLIATPTPSNHIFSRILRSSVTWDISSLLGFADQFGFDTARKSISADRLGSAF